MKLTQFEIQIIPLKDKISRLAFYLLSDKAEAEDATQEVFLKLWNLRDDLSAVENMQAYVLRITRNLCLDKIRAQNRRAQPDDLVDDIVVEKAENPHEQTEIRDTLSVVRKMIASLPEAQRTVITLRDIEGLEFDEIAEITGMNENAIKVNLSRARKKIRDFFPNK
jgi:RNA polymerase sigma factor (sigma-70 family)